MHDWTRVDAGIFHDFHHGWIEECKRSLSGLLPDDYYALAEQIAGGLGPDVLTLQGNGAVTTSPPAAANDNSSKGGGLLPASPKARFVGETDMEYYRRKKSSIVIRRVSGDRVVAVLEIVSPGNKAGRHALRAFVEKAAELLGKRMHLLVIDPFPPGRPDPQGMHAAIWEEITGEEQITANNKPLTLAAYESAANVRAYLEFVAVGDALPEMPLFLEPGAHVPLPLETTYRRAWEAVPRRWQRVLDEAGEI